MALCYPTLERVKKVDRFDIVLKNCIMSAGLGDEMSILRNFGAQRMLMQPAL